MNNVNGIPFDHNFDSQAEIPGALRDVVGRETPEWARQGSIHDEGAEQCALVWRGAELGTTEAFAQVNRWDTVNLAGGHMLGKLDISVYVGDSTFDLSSAQDARMLAAALLMVADSHDRILSS
jgi:hypothetical protein